MPRASYKCSALRLKPLRAATSPISSPLVKCCISFALRRLENDDLDDVGHVLAAIRDDLKKLVDFLPLDDVKRIGSFIEQGYEAVAQEIIGNVLKTIHFDCVLMEGLVLAAQRGDPSIHGLDGLDDHIGERPTGRGWVLDPGGGGG